MLEEALDPIKKKLESLEKKEEDTNKREYFNPAFIPVSPITQSTEVRGIESAEPASEAGDIDERIKASKTNQTFFK
jgi:hypothetical protein